MKKQTFNTILKMLEDDPLTETQKQAVCDFMPTYLTTQEVADMFNVTEQTVRKLPIPKIVLSKRLIKYRLSDINKYINEMEA